MDIERGTLIVFTHKEYDTKLLGVVGDIWGISEKHYTINLIYPRPLVDPLVDPVIDISER